MPRVKTVKTTLRALSAARIEAWAEEGIPFDTGTMSGSRRWLGEGQLAGSTRDRFKADAHHTSYVILSYATPIAWRIPGGWVIPADTYGMTTARHQGELRGLRRVD